MCSLPILDFALPADYLSYIEEKERGREMTTPQIWDAALNARLHIIPHIGPLLRVDDEIFRLFRTCHRTWRDGTPLITSDLMHLASHWESLALPKSCSYTPPTGDALHTHEKRWTEFTDFQKFREALSTKLQADGDGWIPAHRWDETQDIHKEIFDAVMESTKEPDADMTVDDWLALWPYDVPC